MTLQRPQIDVLLENLEATAWGRYRADPADPTLSRDIVQQARALLRVAALDEHLHICDSAQHLLLRIGGDGVPEATAPTASSAAAATTATMPEPVRDDGILRAVQPTRERVPDLGIALVADPFDLDAYAPADVSCDRVLVDVAPSPIAAMPVAEIVQVADAAVEREKRAAAERERRAAAAGDDAPVDDGASLRAGLTAQQLATLETMSHFGWSLRFVRRPMFQPPVPVAFDRNRERFVVVEADGSVNDAPDLRLRG